MRRGIYRFILIPAFEGIVKRRKTFHYWRKLERTQWLSTAELERIQFDALGRLVSHAFSSCPYYQKAWLEQGLNPKDLKIPKDFERWPIIDRSTIQANRLGMQNRRCGATLIAKSTGGSSGVPLQFDLDRNNYEWRHAAWHRGYSWAMADLGTKQFYLWGTHLDQPSLSRRWKDFFYNRLYRRLMVNSFQLSDERVPEFLQRLNRYQPDVIIAYTNPLYFLARRLAELKLKPFRPRSIVVGAEKIHPFQRELIEAVFQAPVFETYGSREFSFIAGECDRHRGLHFSMENLLLEIVDEDGWPTPHGEEGNVVITDLYNYGMPFVRYANGDRAVAGWDQCTCGRGLPLLKKVVGRRLDMIQTPDGRRIPGEFFPHLMKDYPAVRRFQVVQEQPDRIELRLVVKTPFDEESCNSLHREIRNVLGPSVRLDLRPVDDIPLTKAGKLHVVINRISSENEDALISN
jgi:phenylacetate-CoA ligase